MITQIDVRAVLAQSVAAFHADLVTRPTGRAVRISIEQELLRTAGPTVVVLDFSAVRLIDCSCADEIVAKLLRASLDGASPEAGTFFLIRGLADHQADLLEDVLGRHELALVAETGGRLTILGWAEEKARAAFEWLAKHGGAAAEDLAADLKWPLDQARAALEDLAGRRLVLHAAGRYLPLPAA